MKDISDFFYRFVEMLTASELKDSSDYHLCFANAGLWTNFMLGSGNDRGSGILRQSLGGFFPRNAAISHDRYNDIAVFDGNWRNGNCLTTLVLEHENDISELKGTMSDLLRTQAIQKIAVFYDGTASSRKSQYETQIGDVFEYFDRQGFVEAGTTQYLVVFGPSSLLDCHGVGEWCAMRFTHATVRSVSWL